MCFLKWFKKKTEFPVVEQRLIIPHPEEPPDYTRTLANINFVEVLEQWFEQWDVPVEHLEFWRLKIVAEITETIPYPAGTWEQDGIRHLTVRPEWLNPGVIAHEQAHNSYSLLTIEQREMFSITYNSLKATDPLIKLLYSKNTYGLTNDVEGHAEIYRYLGQSLPEILRVFYPRLF